MRRRNVPACALPSREPPPPPFPLSSSQPCSGLIQGEQPETLRAHSAREIPGVSRADLKMRAHQHARVAPHSRQGSAQVPRLMLMLEWGGLRRRRELRNRDRYRWWCRVFKRGPRVFIICGARAHPKALGPADSAGALSNSSARVKGAVTQCWFWKQRQTHTPVVRVAIDAHPHPTPPRLCCQQTAWNPRRSCGHPAACLQVCCHWLRAVPIGCWLQVLSGSAWQREGFGRWNRGLHIGVCKLVGEI